MDFRFRVADYPRMLKEAPNDAHRQRLLVHGLPRCFHQATPQERAAAIEASPPLTNSRWDALLAAVTEHVARLHGLPVPHWVEQPERFLETPWILSDNPVIAVDSILYAPAAFIRHGTLIDPLELDRRGGEIHEWRPR